MCWCILNREFSTALHANGATANQLIFKAIKNYEQAAASAKSSIQYSNKCPN